MIIKAYCVRVYWIVCAQQIYQRLFSIYCVSIYFCHSIVLSIFIFSQYFFKRFYPVEKSVVTLYCLYRDCLTLSKGNPENNFEFNILNFEFEIAGLYDSTGLQTRPQWLDCDKFVFQISTHFIRMVFFNTPLKW